MQKIEIARHQLGTALALFIQNLDPISVHCLACGGCEIIESLSQLENKDVFTNSLLREHPEVSLREFRSLRSKHWNSFKHASTKNGKKRDDTDIIASFSDLSNDHILLIGWTDYVSVTGRLPLPAQVFQIWYFALYEEKLASHVDKTPFRNYFPDIKNKTRLEQKFMLKIACDIYISDEIESKIETENDPLIYPCKK